MPSTSIPTDESILTVKDCQAFSNMLHAEWRGYVQNAYSMDALVQSGLLTATADYGNTYGYFIVGLSKSQMEHFRDVGPIIITS